jgi:glycosyltransferase involved in cell wall biosynthesis
VLQCLDQVTLVLAKTVDIVIPCYNGARYLPRAVDSALAQTYRPLRILVVDDGSTDATPAVVNSFGGRVAYRHKENGGQASARNAGAADTHGDYLCFLDADDIMLPDMIGDLVQHLDASPQVDLCHCLTLAFSRDDLTHPYAENWRPQCSWPSYLDPLSAICAIHASSALIRRRAYDRVGGFPESRAIQGCEDWLFWLQLVLGGGRPEFVPHLGLLYRQHRQASSSSEQGVALRESRLMREAATMFAAYGASPRSLEVLALGVKSVALKWLALNMRSQFEQLVQLSRQLHPHPAEDALTQRFLDADWRDLPALQLQVCRALLDRDLALLACIPFHRCDDICQLLDGPPGNKQILDQVAPAMSAVVSAEMRLAPRHPSFVGHTAHQLGRLELAKGRLAQAEQRLAEAIRLNPHQLAPQADQALVWARIGRHRDAYSRFGQLAARGPRRLALHLADRTLAYLEHRAGPARPALRALRGNPRLRGLAYWLLR